VADGSPGRMGIVVGAGMGVLLAAALAATPFYLPALLAGPDKAERSVAEQVESLRRAIVAIDEHLALMADMAAARGPAAAGEKRDELRSKYMAEHTRLLNEAETTSRALSASDGARESVSAVRVQAMMAYVRGRLSQNRAAFERWQAAAQRSAAITQVGPISDLQNRVAATESRMPTESIRQQEATIQRLDERLAVAQSGQAAVNEQVSTMKAQADALHREASEAREAMQAHAAADGALPPEYETLSNQAREAEARAAGLLNGTLDDAVAAPSQTGEIEVPIYRGGTPRVGIRDLEFQAEALRVQIETISADRQRAVDHLEALKRLAGELTTEQQAMRQSLDDLQRRGGELLAEAARHAEAAGKADDAALKALNDAGRLAKQAATLAAGRARDAAEAARQVSEATPDERLMRVASEGDTEGSMHCLAAESAYHAALCHLARMRADESQARAAAALQGVAGAAAPAQVETARKAAQQLAGDALASYKKASSAIGKTKADSIQGKNYLWQVQVGEAAVHMLLSAAAESDEAAAAEQKLAYDLLKEAAKGREQSPLLTPALDALEFIQKLAG
jgi:chromosome segregation ATPase